MKNILKGKMFGLVLLFSFLPVLVVLFLYLKFIFITHLSFNKKQMKNFIIKPLDFENNSFIPKKFTCDGVNQFPKFEVQALPKNTQTIAIIVDDPDAPMERPFIHLLAVNILATKTIDESTLNKSILGINDFMQLGWQGPCPPKSHGVHHYYFKFFALDTTINLKTGFNLQQFNKVLGKNKKHILGINEIIGLYSRK